MIDPSELARCLSRLCPLDGDDGNGRMLPNWDDANLKAARHLSENWEKYREQYSQSVLSKVARASEISYMMVKEGRRLRNDFLRAVNV